VNTFKALILTAPEDLRAQFRSHPTAAEVRAALTLPARPSLPVSHRFLRAALRQLACQITDLDTALKQTSKTSRPGP